MNTNLFVKGRHLLVNDFFIDDDTNTVSLKTDAASAIGKVFEAALKKAWPVGQLWFNASNEDNPATVLGFGTWERYAEGRVLVGFSTSNVLFDTPEKIGGSYDAVAIEHNHTFSGITASAGAHQHSAPTSNGAGGPYEVASASSGFDYFQSAPTSVAGNHSHTYSGTTSTAGTSPVNANVQPYITVYIWKRVS